MPISPNPSFTDEDLERLESSLSNGSGKYQYPVQFSRVGRLIIGTAMKAYQDGDYEGMEFCASQLDFLDMQIYLGVDLIWDGL